VSQPEPSSPTDSASSGDGGGERLCLFGGTFDPIHEAHLRIASEAMKKFALNRVLFVPARNPPHKDLRRITRYEHRFRMVEIACAPYPVFSASRLEEGNQRSYTVDTLQRFRNEVGSSARLFFLIGSDAFDELETWNRWEEVVKLTDFIVVTRPGHEYRAPMNARVHRLDGLLLPVSSSSIRARLAAGEPTPELPSGVRQYIEKHRLYGFGRRSAIPLSGQPPDQSA
jgi:nicotinate-nucleotide adenylyltransferase